MSEQASASSASSASLESSAGALPASFEYGDLTSGEIFWRDHQVWLHEHGYLLRPRFLPGSLARAHWVDDPRNHAVPILETLEVPDDKHITIIVMPLLRKYCQPRFDTFGEAVDFFSQIIEGVKFLHDHNIAHRDLNGLNIMMEGSKMFPDGWSPHHPKLNRDFYSGRARLYTRTQRPPKYYIIDFGISRQYDTRDPPPLEDPHRGGDKSVPEFQLTEAGEAPEPCDPFPTDIYYLGNLILHDFVEGHPDYEYRNRLRGFGFMRDLAKDMTAPDPAERPTIDEVVEPFAAIRRSLNFWTLRSRVVKVRGFPDPRRPLRHWCLRIGYILRRVPAIPSYQ
ncbi:kinase-like domain-containing protein [Mycena belliarum]|uniref:Kinase-like domain-containing protein n=1 Tax=Mycena belliarum TaxID=1033014 RepID=A0AAD6U845_9AGAR|nr:kinase-like domain-containing protein [Mycena belliae]